MFLSSHTVSHITFAAAFRRPGDYCGSSIGDSCGSNAGEIQLERY